MKIQLQSHMYTVQCDYDADGWVQYFQLVDSAGEIVFEADYSCDKLTVEHIDQELSQSARFLRDPILQKLYPVTSEHPVVPASPSVKTLRPDTGLQQDLTVFDEFFPHYADKPVEQRLEAYEIFESVAHESLEFQKLCVEEYFELLDL